MNTSTADKQHPAIIPLPAFNDNYIWLLRCGNACAIVDPGDSAPVLQYLRQHALTPAAILITHHHADHTGGIPDLLRAYPDLPVHLPTDPNLTHLPNAHPAREGDTLTLCHGALHLTALELPGHTATHIGWLARLESDPHAHLFCGDTLFCAGCGRLLGGTAEQLHHSLTRIATLPEDTRLYPAHEYTLSNLAFAQAADPDNPVRDAYLAEAQQLRTQHRPTLPTTVARERAINPFLRAPTLARFTELRAWKDRF